MRRNPNNINLDRFPDTVRDHLVPSPGGRLFYRCLGCGGEHGIESLLYTCPGCRSVLLIEDGDSERIRRISGRTWRDIFDFRKMLTLPALKGIFRYHEFIAPNLPLDAVIYLGEGHTPMVEANRPLQKNVGIRFYFKNDGQNPSASFKDRGMAGAFSFLNYLLSSGRQSDILAVCASTGDTSAAAALYAAYLAPKIKSAVLLPHQKVTPQQLAQPLGSGAKVFELPGVFDDCMKVVEALSERYPVALLNSKNAWRILGQESYAYEIAQDLDYDLSNMVVVVPIGNAGNITAVMRGFIKFYRFGIIESLPKIIGVQSAHADPVFQYYHEPDPGKRRFAPVTVKPSAAQAAMIGNPVSMPRVIDLAAEYDALSKKQNVFVVQVTEQEIMDKQLLANRNGHIACTHGGETLAGLMTAFRQGIVNPDEMAVLDSTAHAIKFSGFQQMYFEDDFPPEYGIIPNPDFINRPTLVRPTDIDRFPASGAPLTGNDMDKFVTAVSKNIAEKLDLKPK